MSHTTYDYINLLRGYIEPDNYVYAALLLIETKEEFRETGEVEDSEDRIYQTMLSVADRLKIVNPFKNKILFSRIYTEYRNTDVVIDWELLMAESLRLYRYPTLSRGLINEYAKRCSREAKTVLVAEGEKFLPYLKKFVDEFPESSFVITTEKTSDSPIFNRIFAEYDNVEILNASIYKYGFTNSRFDLIFSLPNFGTRVLAEDNSFMSRDQDAVALENLLLHTTSKGELIITVPARITYGHGKNSELRRFIQQSYRLKEIAELPEGSIAGTGIKTYLINVINEKPGDDDIIIRRYETKTAKTKSQSVNSLIIDNETFVMLDELDELGDWNINRVFSQQDEDWLRYQKSEVRKITIGDVAEIFRGKSITNKEVTGSIGVVNISNIREYDIDYENLDRFEEEERKYSNYLLRKGDLLLPARGTAIRTAVFNEQNYPCIASSNVIVIRPDPKLLNSTFLKLFLDSPLGVKMLHSMQQGNTIINISYKDLNGLEIPLPTIDEQLNKANEYNAELSIYRETIATAEERWNKALQKLREF